MRTRKYRHPFPPASGLICLAIAWISLQGCTLDGSARRVAPASPHEVRFAFSALPGCLFSFQTRDPAFQEILDKSTLLIANRSPFDLEISRSATPGNYSQSVTIRVLPPGQTCSLSRGTPYLYAFRARPLRVDPARMSGEFLVSFENTEDARRARSLVEIHTFRPCP